MRARARRKHAAHPYTSHTHTPAHERTHTHAPHPCPTQRPFHTDSCLYQILQDTEDLPEDETPENKYGERFVADRTAKLGHWQEPRNFYEWPILVMSGKNKYDYVTHERCDVPCYFTPRDDAFAKR